MRIAIVKEPSIFLEGILSVMEVEFPNYDVVTTTPGNIEALDAYIIDLVIFDIDSKINLMPAIQQYLEKNKKVIVWTEDKRHPDTRYGRIILYGSAWLFLQWYGAGGFGTCHQTYHFWSTICK
ncbi:DNA-binding NarL/FixJ family response regulator [Gracilibacillus halotolerans]|uniref:DNA-binding NarL/FixJ family response regulator n=1 Tax=Gracilibacillus halotolerans TaxID=74386 RepID=A0A841RRU0_9BACI|nr:hypothetical protein [Gracilibacillus halotolerans]MBB6514056.1 DNA-binding NarL/FixJ family response regulator [Gracilibacillus halotolerans]